MEPTPITPALLLPVTDLTKVEELFELTAEEAALRHRLELRVERALYRAAVVLQAVHDCQSESSHHDYLDRGWRDEEKVQRALSEVETALQELRTRRLYCSTHHSFDQYLRDRFGSCIVEVYPDGGGELNSLPPNLRGTPAS